MFADQTRALIISYGSQQLHRQILGKTRQKKGKNRCSVLRTRAAGKTPLIPCCACLRWVKCWALTFGGQQFKQALFLETVTMHCSINISEEDG